MPHPFQIVFRFSADSPLTSADIEDDIAEALDNLLDDPAADHIVDGNEIGDGIDIFVVTRNPRAAFSLCRPMLERLGLLDFVIVACRPDEGGDWSILHPPGHSGSFRP